MPRTAIIELPVIAGYNWDQLRSGAVFILAASSFLVFVEPAPVDLLFFVTLLFFLRSGLSLTIGAAPMVLLLVLYNLGGFASVIPVAGKEKTMMFAVTSTYMAMSAIFLAYYLSYDPVRRFRVIRAGLIVAGLCAAIAGLLDYADIGGLFPNTALKGRATGTFKDPNVFSTFIILPGMLLMHGLMTGEARHKFWSFIGLLIISAGVFFSFSRGAWINYLAASVLLALMTFMLSPQGGVRKRIFVFMVVGAFAGFLAFTILMSIENVRTMFLERFSLLQSYDSGETGRFGNQLNSIPVLMTLPLGFGPLQYRSVFGMDPHNTFINSFASYGWLGGISYLLLIVTTIAAGLRSIFTKTPWQYAAICVFCPLLTTILQGVQIDTDHWRHFYWLLGMNWGLFAATLQPVAIRDGLAALRPQRTLASA